MSGLGSGVRRWASFWGRVARIQTLPRCAPGPACRIRTRAACRDCLDANVMATASRVRRDLDCKRPGHAIRLWKRRGRSLRAAQIARCRASPSRFRRNLPRRVTGARLHAMPPAQRSAHTHERGARKPGSARPGCGETLTSFEENTQFPILSGSACAGAVSCSHALISLIFVNIRICDATHRFAHRNGTALAVLAFGIRRKTPP